MNHADHKPAWLAFENGVVLEGRSFGAPHEHTGEVVFNTALSGYQEILTDPSYKGQMVLMTDPEIGITGINPFDYESSRCHLEGFIVKNVCESPSHWQSTQSLPQFLKESGVPAIAGLDTRFITRMLRTEGALKAVLTTQEQSKHDLIEKAKNATDLSAKNLAAAVSTTHVYEQQPTSGRTKAHIVAFDFGIKQSILKNLTDRGAAVSVVPWNTSAQDTLALKPDGIFLSNGPGDPAAVTEAIETVRQLMGQKPIFGICLGHQIMALALGGKTYKLTFGHHGANHPIHHKKSGRIEITSQNHSFSVDGLSLPSTWVDITHINLNDHTVEGFAVPKRNIFCVQYHPESSPGPLDSLYLFDAFMNNLETRHAHI